MICYAIKIDGRYFKNYKYADKRTNDRFAGIQTFNGVLREGDIYDVILTDTPERTETRRGVGNTIKTLYDIDVMRDKVIEIIPIEG